MTKAFRTTTNVGTPSDPPYGIVDPVALDTDYDPPLRGFVCAVGGTVKVTMADGSLGTYPACVAGSIYGGFIKRIHTSGTSATGIVGFC